MTNNRYNQQKIDYGGQKHKWANELNRFVVQAKKDFINYYDCLKIAAMLDNYDGWYDYDYRDYARLIQKELDFYNNFTERLQLYLADTKRKYKMYYAFTIINDTVQKDLKKNECYKRTSFYFDWIDDLKVLLKINVRGGKYYNFIPPALYDPQHFENKTEEDLINDVKAILNGNSIGKIDLDAEIEANIEANKRVQENIQDYFVVQGAF